MFPLDTKILITDDMFMMRSVQQQILNKLGYKDISLAENGEMAYTMIVEAKNAGKPFGLILSDWMMPKMKGIELLQKVRATPGLEKVPFVIITAEIEKEQIMQAVKAGVTQYISKPFTDVTIAEKLKLAYIAAQKKAA